MSSSVTLDRFSLEERKPLEVKENPRGSGQGQNHEVPARSKTETGELATHASDQRGSGQGQNHEVPARSKTETGELATHGFSGLNSQKFPAISNPFAHFFVTRPSCC